MVVVATELHRRPLRFQPDRSARRCLSYRYRAGFLVELRDRAYAAEQVVIATGPFQTPRVPAIAEQLDAGFVQMHSSDYRGPGNCPTGPAGGGRRATPATRSPYELAAAHEVHLSVGSRQTPLPQRLLGRDLFRYLEAGRFMRVTVESRLGQRLQYRETLIGSSPRAARRRHGIELRGRAVEASSTEIRFADGSALSAKAVIWATGFVLDSLLRSERRSSTRTGRRAPPRRHRRARSLRSSACRGSTPAAQTTLLGWVKGRRAVSSPRGSPCGADPGLRVNAGT